MSCCKIKTGTTNKIKTGTTNFPIIPVPVFSVLVYARYRYEHRTERTELLGTGMYIVPNVPNFSVPVWRSYRTYRTSRYRYGDRTERTERLGTGTDCCTGTTGTGTNCVPNVPNFPVPVRTSYRTYRSPRYGYEHHTEGTELLGTGIPEVYYRWYASVCTLPNTTLIFTVERKIRTRLNLLSIPQSGRGNVNSTREANRNKAKENQGSRNNTIKSHNSTLPEPAV